MVSDVPLRSTWLRSFLHIIKSFGSIWHSSSYSSLEPVGILVAVVLIAGQRQDVGFAIPWLMLTIIPQ